MEAAFALLLPLVAGYLYVSTCKRLKYKHSREDGHRLYFRIAYYGLMLFVVAAGSLGAAYWWLIETPTFQAIHGTAIEAIKPLLKEPDKASAQLGFISICVVTVLLGRWLPYLDNLVFKGRAEEALLEAASEDDLEMILLEAAVQYKSIAVTTNSKKVYVGLVLQTGEPRTGRRMIAMLPFMSGYRTEDGRVIFTTFYDQVYAERAKERDDDESNDFRLILPIDKVQSVSFFDTETYAKFNAAPAPSTPPRRLVVRKARAQLSRD